MTELNLREGLVVGQNTLNITVQRHRTAEHAGLDRAACRTAPTVNAPAWGLTNNCVVDSANAEAFPLG